MQNVLENRLILELPPPTIVETAHTSDQPAPRPRECITRRRRTPADLSVDCALNNRTEGTPKRPMGRRICAVIYSKINARRKSQLQYMVAGRKCLHNSLKRLQYERNGDHEDDRAIRDGLAPKSDIALGRRGSDPKKTTIQGSYLECNGQVTDRIRKVTLNGARCRAARRLRSTGQARRKGESRDPDMRQL